MPARYDRCVKSVKQKIRTGKIPKTYKANGRKKSNPYAICSKLRATGKKKKLIPMENFLDVVFNPSLKGAKAVKKGKKWFWEK